MKTLKKKISVGNLSKLLSDNELKRVMGGYGDTSQPCYFWCYGKDGEPNAGIIVSNTCYNMDFQCRDNGYNGASSGCNVYSGMGMEWCE